MSPLSRTAALYLPTTHGGSEPLNLHASQPERKKSIEEKKKPTPAQAKPQTENKQQQAGEREREKKQEATHQASQAAAAAHVSPPGTMLFDDPKRRNKLEKAQIIPRTKTQKVVALFSHLPQYEREESLTSWLKNSKDQIHPEIIKLAFQFASHKCIGANNRCIAMLETFKKVISDYKTPVNATLNRHLDSYLKPLISYLVQFRPLSSGMGNAIRYLKCKIAEIPSERSESEAKEIVCNAISTYIQNRIKLADELIAQHGNSKINNGDVILTFAQYAPAFGHFYFIA